MGVNLIGLFVTDPAWLGLLPLGVIAVLPFLATRFERLTLKVLY